LVSAALLAAQALKGSSGYKSGVLRRLGRDREARRVITAIPADVHHKVGISDAMLSFKLGCCRLCLWSHNPISAGGNRDNDIARLPEADRAFQSL
jgi:hypothetical protein